jgi:hypothetical protein
MFLIDIIARWIAPVTKRDASRKSIASRMALDVSLFCAGILGYGIADYLITDMAVLQAFNDGGMHYDTNMTYLTGALYGIPIFAGCLGFWGTCLACLDFVAPHTIRADGK